MLCTLSAKVLIFLHHHFLNEINEDDEEKFFGDILSHDGKNILIPRNIAYSVGWVLDSSEHSQLQMN